MGASPATAQTVAVVKCNDVLGETYKVTYSALYRWDHGRSEWKIACGTAENCSMSISERVFEYKRYWSRTGRFAGSVVINRQTGGLIRESGATGRQEFATCEATTDPALAPVQKKF
jgi:hypothetical protein